MLTQKSIRMKSGGRDAALIAHCLAYGTYRAVVAPTADESVRELQTPKQGLDQNVSQVWQAAYLVVSGVPYAGNRNFITKNDAEAHGQRSSQMP